MSLLYFEDIQPGQAVVSPVFKVDREEMVAFARVWDPLPFHVDEAAGRETHGSLIAPGLFVLGVKLRLIHQSPHLAVLASMGYDEVRFHEPVRPGDELTLRREWLSGRLSQSRPDRGIIKARYLLNNQEGRTVMSHLDTLLVRRRPSPTTNA